MYLSRLIKMDANYDSIRFFTMDMSNWVEKILKVYEEESFDVLIIDSVIAMGLLTNVIRDENANMDMQRLVTPLRQLMSEINIGVLLIHHVKKSDHNTPRGGSSLLGAVDSSFVMTKDKNDWRVRHIEVQGTRVGDQDFSVRLEGECQDLYEPDYDVSFELTNGRHSLKARIVEFVDLAEPGSSANTKEIQDGVKGRKDRKTDALKELVEEGNLHLHDLGNGRAKIYSIYPPNFGESEPRPKEAPLERGHRGEVLDDDYEYQEILAIQEVT